MSEAPQFWWSRSRRAAWQAKRDAAARQARQAEEARRRRAGGVKRLSTSKAREASIP
jgi:hypothetical protein